MPYYDTIDEDLKRAREMLAEGRGTPVVVPNPLAPEAPVSFPTGGTIYGKDTYAAYMLLQSFVAEIERLRQEYTVTHITWSVEGVRIVNGVPDGSQARLICKCGTTLVCPDLGCGLNKVPEPTLDCAGCDKPIPTKTVPMFCPTCSSAEERTRLRDALQTVMNVLGPTGVPENVDYGDKWNLAGLSHEVGAALDAVRSVGIEYKRRRVE
jgi:hypothetical protein